MTDSTPSSEWHTVADKNGRTAEEVTLNDEWTMWFERNDQEKSSHLTETDYLKSLLNMGTFKTLKGFLAKWGSVSGTSITGNVHIFKKGIKPIWEDERNINGGKWSVTISKDSEEYAEVTKMWLALVAAVFSEELGYANQINGVVLSARQWGTNLQVWNRDADSEDQQETVKQRLHKFLKVRKVKYVKHKISLQKNIETMHLHDDKQKSKGPMLLDAKPKFSDRRVSPDRRSSPPRAHEEPADKFASDWNAPKTEAAAKLEAERQKEAARLEAEKQKEKEAMEKIYAVPTVNPWRLPEKAAPVAPVPAAAPAPVQAPAPEPETKAPPKNPWNLSALKKSSDIQEPPASTPALTAETAPPAPPKNPWQLPVATTKKLDFASILEEEKAAAAAAPRKAPREPEPLPAAPSSAPVSRRSSRPEGHNTRARKNSLADVNPVPTPAVDPAPASVEEKKPARKASNPPAPVWDGKRVIEQANNPAPAPAPVAPTSQPLARRRSSASEQGNAKPIKAPKTQPLPTTTPELEPIPETPTPAAPAPDQWQVVPEKKVRAKKEKEENNNEETVHNKREEPQIQEQPSKAPTAEIPSPASTPSPAPVPTPASDAENAEEIIQLPAATAQKVVVAPVEVATTPAPAPVASAPPTAAAPVKAKKTQKSKEEKAQKSTKEGKLHKRPLSAKGAAAPAAPAPVPEPEEPLPKPFPFQQVAIAGGLVLVSIVSYTLFM